MLNQSDFFWALMLNVKTRYCDHESFVEACTPSIDRTAFEKNHEILHHKAPARLSQGPFELVLEVRKEVCICTDPRIISVQSSSFTFALGRLIFFFISFIGLVLILWFIFCASPKLMN